MTVDVRSALHARNECLERRKLLGNDLAGGLILESQRLLIELRLRHADEDLRRAKNEGIEKRQAMRM